jgi:hypothetical protein
MGGFAEVSEIHAATIFRVEVCKMLKFLCILLYMIPFRKTSGVGTGSSFLWIGDSKGKAIPVTGHGVP